MKGGPLFCIFNIFLRWAKSMSLKIILTRLQYGTCGPSVERGQQGPWPPHVFSDAIYCTRPIALRTTIAYLIVNFPIQTSIKPTFPPLRLLGVGGMEEVQLFSSFAVGQCNRSREIKNRRHQE